jgi:hypothetical protein
MPLLPLDTLIYGSDDGALTSLPSPPSSLSLFSESWLLLVASLLVLPSSSGGLTVHADDEKFNQIMAYASSKLHVAGHAVGTKRVFLHSAGRLR